jgi:hypothetical protein
MLTHRPAKQVDMSVKYVTTILLHVFSIIKNRITFWETAALIKTDLEVNGF